MNLWHIILQLFSIELFMFMSQLYVDLFIINYSDVYVTVLLFLMYQVISKFCF